MTTEELKNILTALPFLNASDLAETHRRVHGLLFGRAPDTPLPRSDLGTLLRGDSPTDRGAIIAVIDQIAREENAARRAWLQARINGESPDAIHDLEREADDLCKERLELIKEIVP